MVVMKQLIFIFLISFFSSNLSNKDVYICKGPKSTKYHYNKKCRGLNNCSTSIYRIEIGEAKKMKRTLCGWED